MPTIRTNGAELYYRRAGSGAPVLLVPGLFFGADHWEPQIEALAPHHDVVALDLRGQHHSEATADPAGYDLWNQADDVAGVIEALGIAPVHWVGLSMGGMIGMRVALRRPELLRDMVLLDTSCEPEEPEKVERYEAMRKLFEQGVVDPVLPVLPPVFFNDRYIAEQPESVEAWLQSLRDGDTLGFVRASRAVDARDGVCDRLGELRLPVLVAHGTADVPIEPEKAERLAALIPGAELRWIEGAGHQSNVDSAAAVNDLLLQWLGRAR